MTRVLFAGSHVRSFHCLRHLVQSVAGAAVVAVVSNEGHTAEREDQDVRIFARNHGIPLVSIGDVAHLGYDLGISVLFDRMLRPEVVDRPRLGFVNLHLGPLPRLRGVNSVLHAIRLARRNNDWTFGVTLHYMDHGLDTGPVIDRIDMPIFEDDIAASLHARACEGLYELFVRNIERLVRSDTRVPSQPQSGPSSSFRRSLVNHEVDLSAHPDEVYDLVRALSFPGKPKPYAVIGGRRFYLSID